MAVLREQTRVRHCALEDKLPWQEICSDQSRYVNILARFYGFFCVWEPFAESQLRKHARDFMQPRRKTGLLSADLRWFGWNEDDFATAATIAPGRLSLNGQPTTLGSYYVLEGSTLGGQILSRTLERQLGLHNGEGYSYFRSYGSGVSEAWAEFGKFLSMQLANDSDVSAAVAGATTTFGVLEEWLTGQ